MKKTTPVLIGLIVASSSCAAQAEAGFWAELGQGKQLSWQFSPGATLHYTYDSEHRPVIMLGLERESMRDGGVDGAAFFTNSFGQPTLYVYPWGHAYHGMYGIDRLTFKWTAGLMYGYRDPYQHKVPLNYDGLSLVAMPALEYSLGDGWSGQLNFLGTAALMLEVNRSFR